MHRRFRRSAACCLVLLTATSLARAAETPAGRTPLPQSQPYQRALRDYLATLTERDFDHGVTEPLTVAPEELPPEEQYRHYVMTLMHQPLVGWKRGTPAINAPSRLFLLSSIEGPLPPDPPPPPKEPIDLTTVTPDYTPVDIPVPTGIVVPPVWPETLAAFTAWDYAGNPYRNNRGLKLRALVTAVVKMIMLDDYFEQTPDGRRADWNAYQLVTFASTYERVKDVVPPEACAAFEAGLLRLGKMMLEWGPRGDEPNKDLSLPVGLWYVARSCGDSAFAADVEALARKMLTDPQYFNEAGYWLEPGGGFDVGFGGGANFYAVWLALMTDWPFARDAVERAYQLRAHLAFPDPDGFVTGPSHFNRRLGSPASSDQWGWDGARDVAAALLTDEALPFVKPPTPETVAGAAANRVAWFNSQIKQNPVRPDAQGRKSSVRTGYWANDDLRGQTWTWRLWQTYNFPIGINPGFDFYRQGAYKHLQALDDARSPKLKSPYLRDESFTREFGGAFTAVKRPHFAALVHSGDVGEPTPADGSARLAGAPGFGGGQLSTFWTPATGAVIVSRRSGTTSETNYDPIEKWRELPIHAVSGRTTDDGVFSTARMARPTTQTAVVDERGMTLVEGELHALAPDGAATKSRIAYRRDFLFEPDGVRVTTSLSSDGSDPFAELYETLPVYLRDARRQPNATPTSIEFQVAGKWQAATTEWQAGVTAVRLTRFEHAVVVTFDAPRRVKLSAEEWRDTYLTQATCRNVLVDLLDGAESATIGMRRVGYRIAAAKP